MAENSKIEWCHHTFNPWIGCTKIGPGCDNCYAEADFGHRRKVVQWGSGQPRKRTAPSTWAMPVKWNAEAERLGIRYRVFSASLADVFDNDVDPSWRADLFHLIEETPNLDWLLVTKRIGNAEKMILDARRSLVGSSRLVVPEVLHNVWLGATITNQAEADRDIPKLLEVPAVVRFLSMEPLLGPISLRWLPAFPESGKQLCERPGGATNHLDGLRRIDWIIVGGESGPNARPMHPQWARNIRDQCEAAEVPFLFKQHGEFAPGENVMQKTGSVVSATWFGEKWVFGVENLACEDGHINDEPDLYRVGKKAAGRLLDGVQHDGYPDVPHA